MTFVKKTERWKGQTEAKDKSVKIRCVREFENPI